MKLGTPWTWLTGGGTRRPREVGRSQPSEAPLKRLRLEEGAAACFQQWGGASPSGPYQDTQWRSCSDANMLAQSKHIKPDKPFQQGSGRGEETCARTRASHDRCQHEGHALRKAPGLTSGPAGHDVQAPRKCHDLHWWYSAFQSDVLRFTFSTVCHSLRNLGRPTSISWHSQPRHHRATRLWTEMPSEHEVR